MMRKKKLNLKRRKPKPGSPGLTNMSKVLSPLSLDSSARVVDPNLDLLPKNLPTRLKTRSSLLTSRVVVVVARHQERESKRSLSEYD